MEVGPQGKGAMVPNFKITSQSAKKLRSGVFGGADSESGTRSAPPVFVNPLWRWAPRERVPWVRGKGAKIVMCAFMIKLLKKEWD